MIHRFLYVGSCFALVSLAGCNMGDVGSAPADSGEGGIGGTGIGVITGLGSVRIDRDHEFSIGPNTVFRVDGKVVSEEAFGQSAVGLWGSYQVANDVDAAFTHGTLLSIDARHQFHGPITSLTPLKVLDQLAMVKPDTLVVDEQGVSHNVTEIDQVLAPGTLVSVSGFQGVGNTIRVTQIRVDLQHNGWKLTGYASQVVPNDSFRLGDHKVILNGKIPLNCTPSLKDGDLVKVVFVGTGVFLPGDTVDTVMHVECKSFGLAKTKAAIPGRIKGIVTSVFPDAAFVVEGQNIEIGQDTVFEQQSARTVKQGDFVTVEGEVQKTGVLLAEHVAIDNRNHE